MHRILAIALLSLCAGELSAQTLSRGILRASFNGFGGQVDIAGGLVLTSSVSARQVQVNDLGRNSSAKLNGAGMRDFGRSVGFVGDLNGDRFPEIAVGAYDAIRLFDGLTHKIIQDVQGLAMGSAIVPLGDVDRDRVPDFAVGAFRPWTNGELLVLSGKTRKVLWKRQGPAFSSGLGVAVAAAGDMNRDGATDVVAGLPGMDVVAVLSGRDGSVLHWVQDPKRPLLGNSVAGGADMDGDGVPDFAAGAPATTVGTEVRGSAAVYSGRDGKLIRAFDNDKPGWAGYTVALVDYDKDRRADLLVGDPLHGGQRGRVTAISGKDGKTLWHRTGPAFSRYGTALAVGLHIRVATGAPNDGTGSVEVYYALPRASISSFGKGCGTKHIPSLESKTVPRFGSRAVFTVKNLPTPTAGFLVLGLSSTTWRGMKLPLDLTRFGMSGCTLYTGFDAPIAFISLHKSSLEFRWWVPVSDRFPVFAQIWAIDGNANQNGVVTSNALKIEVGF